MFILKLLSRPQLRLKTGETRSWLVSVDFKGGYWTKFEPEMKKAANRPLSARRKNHFDKNIAEAIRKQAESVASGRTSGITDRMMAKGDW